MVVVRGRMEAELVVTADGPEGMGVCCTQSVK